MDASPDLLSIFTPGIQECWIISQNNFIFSNFRLFIDKPHNFLGKVVVAFSESIGFHLLQWIFSRSLVVIQITALLQTDSLIPSVYFLSIALSAIKRRETIGRNENLDWYYPCERNAFGFISVENNVAVRVVIWLFYYASWQPFWRFASESCCFSGNDAEFCQSFLASPLRWLYDLFAVGHTMTAYMCIIPSA